MYFFSSFLDVWILLYCFPGVVLSRAEERDRLIFGPIFRWRCKGMFTSENQQKFLGSCKQSLSTGRAQSRGGRLLPRWGGDVLNRDGQGLACWTIGLKLSKCWSFNDFNDPGSLTRHQDSDFPRGHHNQRHRPHPLQVSFCRFHLMHLFLFDRR